MALSRAQLQKLLDNPAMFSADDMEVENEEMLPEAIQEEDELQMDEFEENPAVVPEQEEEADLIAKEPLEPVDLNEEDDITEQELQATRLSLENPELNAMNRLQKRQEVDQMDAISEEEVGDIARDIEAPADLRKKALQRIKQKYLGQ